MKINKGLFSVLAAMVMLSAGCSNGAGSPEAAERVQSPADTQSGGETSGDVAAGEFVEGQQVELEHLRIMIDPQWTVEQGADSVAFRSGEEPVGGIDGLGYAESVESLVPNHSIIKEQKSLEGLAMKAYEAITASDSADESQSETIHIFLLLEDQKVVYDTHFDASKVDVEQAIGIAKTAEVK
jgi:hypothetical protein